MSKNTEPKGVIGFSNTPSYLFHSAIGDLEGRILTIAETLGLDERQENAIKSLLRQAVWKTWNEAYYVPQEIWEAIRKNDEVVQNQYLYLPVKGSS